MVVARARRAYRGGVPCAKPSRSSPWKSFTTAITACAWLAVCGYLYTWWPSLAALLDVQLPRTALLALAVAAPVGLRLKDRCLRPATALLVDALAAAPPLLAIAFFFMGVSHDIFGVLWSTTMQREIPPESLSRVSSYDALGSLMFGPIGLLLAGPVALAIGPKPALIGCAAIIIIVTLLALLSPGVRNLRAPVEVPAPREGEPALAGVDER